MNPILAYILSLIVSAHSLTITMLLALTNEGSYPHRKFSIRQVIICICISLVFMIIGIIIDKRK